MLDTTLRIGAPSMCLYPRQQHLGTRRASPVAPSTWWVLVAVSQSLTSRSKQQ